jgi:hypothetical protein
MTLGDRGPGRTAKPLFIGSIPIARLQKHQIVRVVLDGRGKGSPESSCACLHGIDHPGDLTFMPVPAVVLAGWEQYFVLKVFF